MELEHKNQGRYFQFTEVKHVPSRGKSLIGKYCSDIIANEDDVIARCMEGLARWRSVLSFALRRCLLLCPSQS